MGVVEVGVAGLKAGLEPVVVRGLAVSDQPLSDAGEGGLW